MILTLTPNPSIDATFQLTGTLIPGGVNRLSSATSVAGGKGINVSHAIYKAQHSTLAVFPAAAGDPFLSLLDNTKVPYQCTPVSDPVRVNTTLADPAGETTKINGVGAVLTESDITAMEKTLVEHAQQADWVVMAGSLPPGVPENWYSHLVDLLRAQAPNVKIAIDTSDAPLLAVAHDLEKHHADIMTPNSLELGQIVGVSGTSLEAEALAGNYEPVIIAATKLVKRGLPMALITLGAAGAVLVTDNGVWLATSPPVTPLSTVGAGDCTLAGFVMGISDGLSLERALALGVAYGSTAVTLPGTTIPTPNQVDADRITIRALV